MDFQKLIAEIAKILDRLALPYAVTGGYAVSVWGRVRSTLDIDVIIELPLLKIDVLSKALRQISEASYIDENMVIRAVERKGEFNFIHIESGIKVDFWVQGKDEFSQAKLNRKVPQNILGQTVYFVSPEDLILSKLLWYKESGSEMQLKDVESIIAIQKKLDWKYTRRWAKQQMTLKILERIRHEPLGR